MVTHLIFIGTHDRFKAFMLARVRNFNPDFLLEVLYGNSLNPATWLVSPTWCEGLCLNGDDRRNNLSSVVLSVHKDLLSVFTCQVMWQDHRRKHHLIVLVE